MGSAGKRRKELPPGIYQQEGIPALQPRLGVEALPGGKQENPADVEEILQERGSFIGKRENLGCEVAPPTCWALCAQNPLASPHGMAIKLGSDRFGELRLN